MDPAHLVTPPRAHPSGTANGVDEHQRIQIPWFIGLGVTVVLLLCFVAVVALIFFRRRHQITKEIGHLNGNLNNMHIKMFFAVFLSFLSVFS